MIIHETLNYLFDNNPHVLSVLIPGLSFVTTAILLKSRVMGPVWERQRGWATASLPLTWAALCMQAADVMEDRLQARLSLPLPQYHQYDLPREKTIPPGHIAHHYI